MNEAMTHEGSLAPGGTGIEGARHGSARGSGATATHTRTRDSRLDPSWHPISKDDRHICTMDYGTKNAMLCSRRRSEGTTPTDDQFCALTPTCHRRYGIQLFLMYDIFVSMTARATDALVKLFRIISSLSFHQTRQKKFIREKKNSQSSGGRRAKIKL
jgi:hypothetical protein